MSMELSSRVGVACADPEPRCLVLRQIHASHSSLRPSPLSQQSIDLDHFAPGIHPPKTIVRDFPEAQLVLGSHGKLPSVQRKMLQSKDKAEPFIFFANFKWESRKGWDILVKAFTQEFKVGRGRGGR